MQGFPTPVPQRSALIDRLVGETAEPDRVTAAARALGERALPLIARGLSELSPTYVQIELRSVELGRVADVFQVEGETDPLIVAASSNSPDALLLSMDGAAVSLFTNLMFGAHAEATVLVIERPLSKVELGIAAAVFQRIAEALNGSGTRAMNVRFPLPAPILGEDRRKQIHRDGPSARLIYRVSTPGGAGNVCVTMPQRVVLTPRGGEDATKHGDWHSRFGGEVMRSRIRVEATIPMSRLTLADISDLAVGQVLEMPSTAPAGARLSARDKTLFVCEFGKLGQNYTVRISHAFDPEADLMDGILPH
jgi:flagellar motor switch protein FliM